jgi:DUF971 family protein
MSIKVIDIILHRASHKLEVSFDDGTRYELPCEYLRVESPSAEVQGHSPNQRVWIGGKRDVNISAIEPIGNYAVVLRFNDGHDSGIYTWGFLKTLGEQYQIRWARYLQALTAQGVGRDGA